MSPLRSESRPRVRSCSTATLRARVRISSCSSVGAKLSIGLYPFNDQCVCHAATFADGLETIATTAALQFVQENGGEARAGSSQGMTDGDRAAVDVDLRHIRAGFTLPGKRDAGRSEEHTSELQSRSDLVCRLLLEK